MRHPLKMIQMVSRRFHPNTILLVRKQGYTTNNEYRKALAPVLLLIARGSIQIEIIELDDVISIRWFSPSEKAPPDAGRWCWHPSQITERLCCCDRERKTSHEKQNWVFITLCVETLHKSSVVSPDRALIEVGAQSTSPSRWPVLRENANLYPYRYSSWGWFFQPARLCQHSEHMVENPWDLFHRSDIWELSESRISLHQSYYFKSRMPLEYTVD